MSEPTPRRRFLSWLGTTSVLVASSSFVSSADAQVAKPVDDKWDVSWTDRLTGKFKAMFDSPSVSEGAALFRACIWRDQHKAVYGTSRNDANAVLVLRHKAIDLVMNDAYWTRFEIGKELKLKDAKNKKWTKINPIRVAAAAACRFHGARYFRSGPRAGVDGGAGGPVALARSGDHRGLRGDSRLAPR